MRAAASRFPSDVRTCAVPRMSAAAVGAAKSAIAAASTKARIERHDREMRAMVLDQPGRPLRAAELPEPRPGPGQILVEVEACAICRTDLHIVDGELPSPKLPLVPGHQVVGSVVGDGRRVGIPWLGWADGDCRYCLSGRENLCDRARFTGYDLDGGYAEYAVVDEAFCFALPDGYSAPEAAPLL